MNALCKKIYFKLNKLFYLRVMAHISRLRTLLKEANLLDYQDQFLNYGADCVDQLAQSTKSEFQELMILIGMSEKPLHVRRLVKTLMNMTNMAPEYDVPVQDTSGIMFSGQPEFKTAVSNQLNSATKKRVKSTYYGDITLPTNEVFEALLPKRTEEECKKLLKTNSQIYTKGELNKYQRSVNACAEQFCLRDPLLLVSKKLLFEISKEAVRQSNFKFNRGYSVSYNAKQKHETQTRFKAANKNREDRLQKIEELERSIEKDDLERKMLISKVKNLKHEQKAVGIGIVKTQLDVIEENIFSKRKKLKALNNSQKRSERYFISKIQPEADKRSREIDMSVPLSQISNYTSVHSEKRPTSASAQGDSQSDCSKCLPPALPKTIQHIHRPSVDSKNLTDNAKSKGIIQISNPLRRSQYHPNNSRLEILGEASFEPIIAGSLDVLSYESDLDDTSSNQDRFSSSMYNPAASSSNLDIGGLYSNTDVASGSRQQSAATTEECGLLNAVFTSALLKEDIVVDSSEYISGEADVITSFMDQS